MNQLTKAVCALQESNPTLARKGSTSLFLIGERHFFFKKVKQNEKAKTQRSLTYLYFTTQIKTPSHLEAELLLSSKE